jgi:hypothetical protein
VTKLYKNINKFTVGIVDIKDIMNALLKDKHDA